MYKLLLFEYPIDSIVLIGRVQPAHIRISYSPDLPEKLCYITNIGDRVIINVFAEDGLIIGGTILKKGINNYHIGDMITIKGIEDKTTITFTLYEKKYFFFSLMIFDRI